jgi:glycine cleavage system H protein
MDAFSYNNIFDTKGVEYLIIIAFLILVIPFWQIITRPTLRQKLKKAVMVFSEKILRIPRGLQYSKNHTWAHLNKNGYAVVGIDDLLTHLIGEVEVYPLQQIGAVVKRGEKIAELKVDGKKLEVLSPLSGKMMSFNNLLLTEPDLLINEPYENGWIANIEPQSWTKESSAFVTGDEAIDWENNEFLKFKDFLNLTIQKHAPVNEKVMLQEGGEIIDNPLADFPQEVWSDFQKQFLSI